MLIYVSAKICQSIPSVGVLIATEIEQPRDLVKSRFMRNGSAFGAGAERNKRDIQMISPAPFFFSSSFLSVSSFSSELWPANLMSRGFTSPLGDGGRSDPHTTSTRLVVTGDRVAPPPFLIFSSKLRASATWKMLRIAFLDEFACAYELLSPSDPRQQFCCLRTALLSYFSSKVRANIHRLMGPTILARSEHRQCLVSKVPNYCLAAERPG